MHLENGQKSVLASNLKGFMKAKKLTLSGMSDHGVSWQTAKNLTEGKIGKYITTGLTSRLEKLTGKSMGALITDRIEWSETPLRQGHRSGPEKGATPARTQLEARRMFVVQYADGTEVTVPSGMRISITGPSSIKVG